MSQDQEKLKQEQEEVKEQVQVEEEEDFLAGIAPACGIDGPCDSCQ
jgi:hypothetical protein